MGGENSFKGSQQRIVFFTFFSHGSYKVKWCDRAKEETVVTFLLDSLCMCKPTHTTSEFCYGMFLTMLSEGSCIISVLLNDV